MFYPLSHIHKQPERVINSSHLKQKFKAQRLPYKSHINHGLFRVIEWMNDWMMEADVALCWWNVFVVKCRKCKSSLSKKYKYVPNHSLELSHNWGLSTSTVRQHPSNSLHCAPSFSLVWIYLWLPKMISLCKTVCLIEPIWVQAATLQSSVQCSLRFDKLIYMVYH